MDGVYSKTKLLYDTSNDHQYINLSINNNTDDNILALFEKQQNMPMIGDDATQYMACVVGFSLPINLVPVLICDVIADDVLSYQISFEYLGNVYTKNIDYIAPNNLTIKNWQYYSLYNFSHFVEMINNTFAQVFALSVLPVGCTAAPYMIFDSVTGLFSIIAQTGYTAVKIYFNNSLSVLFDGFHAKLAKLDSARYSQIIVYNNYINSYVIPTWAPGAGSAAYKLTQDYISLDGFNSIKSVILTSNVGIKPETIIYDKLNGKYLADPIIASFSIDHLPANDRILLYSPSVYRFHDIGTKELATNISFQFWAIDKTNNKYPVFIGPDDCCEIKLLFQKKAIKTISL